VKIFASKRSDAPLEARYATAADFCRVFEQEMDRLYLLSLLLTGDHDLAEKCFVGGLELSKSSNAVFRDWARSWARRMVVQNAIQAIRPRSNDFMSPDRVVDGDISQPAEITAIRELPAFDRFAYVLSVLEGYPLRECALLLNCTPGEVNTARMRALQAIVNSVERRAGVKNIGTGTEALRENARFNDLSQLAATA